MYFLSSGVKGLIATRVKTFGRRMMVPCLWLRYSIFRGFFLLVPDRAPTLVGRNTSSTSIQLRWTTILPNHTNGDIQGYRLAYSKHGDQSAWVSALPRDALTWEVTKLEKFTTYDFVITGENRRGYGVDSNTVDIRTDEDSELRPLDADLGIRTRWWQRWWWW